MEGHMDSSAEEANASNIAHSPNANNSTTAAGFADEDDWKTELWDQFSKVCRHGHITGDQLYDVAHEVGMDCEYESLKRVVKPEKWGHIGYTEAVHYITEAAVGNAEAYGHENEEGGESNSDVTYLNPCQYLYYALPCVSKDPDTVYELGKNWRLSSITPQTTLILFASTVFLVISAAMLVLMGILWLRHSTDRQFSIIRQLSLGMVKQTEGFEKTFVESHAKEMEDLAITLSRWIEFMWAKEKLEIIDQLSEDAVATASTLHSIAASKESQMVAALAANIRMLAAVMAGGMTSIDEVKRLAYDYTHLLPGIQLVMVSFAGGTEAVLHAYPHIEDATALGYECVAMMRQGKSGDISSMQAEYEGRPQESVASYFFDARTQVGICAPYYKFAMNERSVEAVAEAVEMMVEPLRDPPMVVPGHSFKKEVIVARRSQTNTSEIEYVSKLNHQRKCPSGADCSQFPKMLMEVLDDGKNRSGLIPFYTGERVFAAAAYIPYTNSVVAIFSFYSLKLEALRERQYFAADAFNFEEERTTEIVFAKIDENTERIVAQANKFRFSEGCTGVCQRSRPSSVNAYDGFQNHGSGNRINPDYRAVPVVGGFSYLLDSVDLVLMIERDVTDIRQLGLIASTNIVKNVNAEAEGSVELQVVKRTNTPATRFFDPLEPCPINRLCLMNGTQVKWREDCPDCSPVADGELNPIEFLVPFRFPERCSEDNCMNPDTQLAEAAIHAAPGVTEAGRGHDYSGREVYSASNLVDNFTSSMIVKVDMSEIEGEVLTSIGISVGVSIGVVLLGVAAMIAASKRILGRIENEWFSYKQGIETEKQSFTAMVQNVLPARVNTKFQKGARVVAEVNPYLAFTIVDIVQFSHMIKGLPPRQVIRFCTYYYFLLNYIAERYKVYCLNSYGDVFVGIGGIEDKKEGVSVSGTKQSSHHDHDRETSPVWAVACFQEHFLQVLSSKYAHFPQHLPIFGELFMERGRIVSDAPMNLPSIRVGCHVGAALSGAIDVGRTPHFDCYGPALSLTQRMQATSQTNRCHVSAPFKETLEALDTDGVFEFDEPRKTVVKGQGTVASFMIRSAYLPMPEDLIADLLIERSHIVYVGNTNKGGKVEASYDRGSSYASSMVSGSTAMSRKSGNSRRSGN